MLGQKINTIMEKSVCKLPFILCLAYVTSCHDMDILTGGKNGALHNMPTFDYRMKVRSLSSFLS